MENTAATCPAKGLGIVYLSQLYSLRRELIRRVKHQSVLERNVVLELPNKYRTCLLQREIAEHRLADRRQHRLSWPRYASGYRWRRETAVALKTTSWRRRRRTSRAKRRGRRHSRRR